MLKLYAHRRQLEGASEHWRRTVCPNWCASGGLTEL